MAVVPLFLGSFLVGCSIAATMAGNGLHSVIALCAGAICLSIWALCRILEDEEP